MDDDPIGTERSDSEWWLAGYFVFAATSLIAVGVLFGVYVL